jgi:hypothetical protein
LGFSGLVIVSAQSGAVVDASTTWFRHFRLTPYAAGSWDVDGQVQALGVNYVGTPHAGAGSRCGGLPRRTRGSVSKTGWMPTDSDLMERNVTQTVDGAITCFDRRSRQHAGAHTQALRRPVETHSRERDYVHCATNTNRVYAPARLRTDRGRHVRYRHPPHPRP